MGPKFFEREVKKAMTTIQKPKITAIAPWFGSKRNLAPEIVLELGPHRVYWELCCGSMAVLLLLEPCVMETAVDLHGDLTNLAKVIQDRILKSVLYRRLRSTLMSEHPLLKKLYPTWTHRKIEVTKALVNYGMRCRHSDKAAKKAVEVLLINGPSYAKPEATSLF